VAQKERAILDAARQAFLDHGYDGARISEIARGAGVSEGSIYSYYETKSALMHALVTEFWGRITEGAVRATSSDTTTFAQLAALARYHLAIVMANFDFVDLTFSLRRRQDGIGGSREQLRGYVAIFDGIVRRGIDRGELRPDVECWVIRDTFYGTLEYSARTLLQREKSSGSREARAVVNNLVAQLTAAHGVPAPIVRSAAATRQPAADGGRLLDRLESLVVRMENPALPSGSPSGTKRRRR
jgi:AcrR family transcriptional regulator